MKSIHARYPHRSLHGFSLIEILVVISIIAVIMGISVPVAIKMLAQSETAQVRGILIGLAAAADDYNVVTGSVVDHTENRDAFGNTINLYVGQPSPNGGAQEDATFGYFVYTAGQTTTTAKLISLAAKTDLTFNGVEMLTIADRIQDGSLNRTTIGQVELLDVWGTPIRYAGGVDHSDSFSEDDYLPAHPTAFFASAGPDGEWGEVDNNNQPVASVDNNGDGEPDAADNVYSFETDN
ncbi:MAG: prepilin-type N-terminal cleavage/methylation domain-containing protein [Planctomycetota bacterium]